MVLAFLAVGVSGPSNFLRGIVESDRSLARTARLKGMKWTYERTFSSDALVLTTKIEPATEWLNSQDFGSKDKMFWDVNRAEISSKGEFGYTEGAWTLMRPTSYANGDFVRVWKKQGKDWKLVFEADTTTDLPRVPTGHVTVPPPPKKPKGRVKIKPVPEPAPSEDVQGAISGIEAKLEAEGNTANAYLDDAYFLRPDFPPSIGYSDDLSTAGDKPSDERFIVDKPSDLACSFGSLSSKDGSWPFLRIWRHTPKAGWQITLEYFGKSSPAAKKQDDSDGAKN